MGVANRQKDFKSKGTQPQSAISVLLQRKTADDLPEKLKTWSASKDIAVVNAPSAYHAGQF
jgi:hypothetical protein